MNSKIFNGYIVYKNGTIINKHGNRLKTRINKYGYEDVLMYYDGKYHHKLVHRIVAFLFLPNDKKYRCINHKDGNKSNNNIFNLEWCNHSENMIHAVKNKLFVVKSGKGNHLSKSILQIKNGNIIACFGSIREAERVTGISNANISSACKGKLKTAGGYYWKYKTS